MSPMSGRLAITASDVRSAADLLRERAVRTPLLEYLPLNEVAGGRVLVKYEGAQHTGSFKFRGAYNRLARIPKKARQPGVVAWSSGNHAQGVAAAAKLLGIPATIVMPADAPVIKLRNTRELGGEVVLYDRLKESREEIATKLANARGATLVPSFDDPYIIAGQGTIGLEIIDQAMEAQASVTRVLVCCGGGGLIAGIATAIKATVPEINIYAVEPAGFDDTARSLFTGRRETIAPNATSICDALLTPSPGELTFPINRQLLSGGLVVTDDQVRAAMRFGFSKMKLVIEPGGAVALAALLAGVAPPAERQGDTVVVVSGANVDPMLYAEIIAGPR
ncbi:MAG: threonine/serine dehydratase [Verrucomicrobia bacterium]|nr:threonine/serine dehydratase [Verrucomicrobiota bacterium]MBV9273929.1 threonine/serine dehydratase [Verrucomicrobiota bacterium]